MDESRVIFGHLASKIAYKYAVAYENGLKNKDGAIVLEIHLAFEYTGTRVERSFSCQIYTRARKSCPSNSSILFWVITSSNRKVHIRSLCSTPSPPESAHSPSPQQP